MFKIIDGDCSKEEFEIRIEKFMNKLLNKYLPIEETQKTIDLIEELLREVGFSEKDVSQLSYFELESFGLSFLWEIDNGEDYCNDVNSLTIKYQTNWVSENNKEDENETMRLLSYKKIQKGEV